MTVTERPPPERPPPADLALDTSALVAILLDEPEAARCAGVLQAALGPLVSAACIMELLMVMESRRGPTGVAESMAFLRETRTISIPVDDRSATDAHAAWLRFGKGRHPAGLNFGDCFTYALAKRWGVPLLCVGNDFARTDLQLA